MQASNFSPAFDEPAWWPSVAGWLPLSAPPAIRAAPWPGASWTPASTVRVLTRDASSAAAADLAALGAQVVVANLDDASSLVTAFAGANIIFSVTNYWEAFRPDCRAAARAQGVSCRRFAADVERQQGINVADAAAETLASLDANGFLVSTLSNAHEFSGGRYKDLYHFDAKAQVFPAYVQAKHPELAAKMSCIHTGYFISFNLLPESYLSKQADGSVEMAFTTSPAKLAPHFDSVGDIGNFTYAVYQMPPGGAYMAAGTTCTWPAFLEIWGRIAGYTVRYRQATAEDMIAVTPDRELGVEVALMFSYSSDPGYDGGMALLTAEDIRKAGIDCPMTWEDWARRQDWTAILDRLS